MKRFFIAFILPFISYFSFCQNVEGALSIDFNKKSAPIIIDYDNGFHSIFYTESELNYYRLNYQFQIEQTGTIDLTKIGYKPTFIEITANRKEIYLYYRRLDSAGIWLITINTFNNSTEKKTVVKSLEKSDIIYGNFSIADTSIFLYGKEKGAITLAVLNGQNQIKSTQLQLDEKLKNVWLSALKLPQFSKTLIHENYGEFENKMHLGTVKYYYNFKKIKIAIDHGYSTSIFEYDYKINQIEQHDFHLDLDLLGTPSAGIYGSFIKGRNIYQAGLFSNGALIQKTDIRFLDTKYSQYVPYGMSKSTGSPVFYLNRIEQGRFVNDNSNPVELHEGRHERYLALNVQKRGAIENFIISEVEPSKLFQSWQTSSNLISPSISRRKNQSLISQYSLLSSSPYHYALNQHLHCMSSSFCFSITTSGDKSPFLGDAEWPLANANSLYFKYFKTGRAPYMPTFAKIDGNNYFCFYSTKEKRFIFIKY